MAEVAAVVVAAGRGTRAGGDLPKQFRRIGGESLLRRALAMLVDHPVVGFVQPVIQAEDRSLFEAASAGLRPCRRRSAAPHGRPRCTPGWRRSPPRRPEIVLVHDAARPFASPALVSRAIEAAAKTGAAVPGLPLADTVKRVAA